jgi:hypothetical protein
MRFVPRAEDAPAAPVHDDVAVALLACGEPDIGRVRGMQAEPRPAHPELERHAPAVAVQLRRVAGVHAARRLVRLGQHERRHLREVRVEQLAELVAGLDVAHERGGKPRRADRDDEEDEQRARERSRAPQAGGHGSRGSR